MTEQATHQLLESICNSLSQVKEKLDSLERRISANCVREWYTTEQAALHLTRSAWTIRFWCERGRCKAEKINFGRGRKGEWRLSHEELLRLESQGPAPERTFHNAK